MTGCLSLFFYVVKAVLCRYPFTDVPDFLHVKKPSDQEGENFRQRDGQPDALDAHKGRQKHQEDEEEDASRARAKSAGNIWPVLSM